MNNNGKALPRKGPTVASYTPGLRRRHGPGPGLLGAHALIGNSVFNLDAEDLGDITDLMLDMSTGTVSYAVLSCGSFLGMNERLLAVPWKALTLDSQRKRLTLDVGKKRLEAAPSFDKSHWPNMVDQAWAQEIHSFYGTGPSTAATSGR